jgi:5-methylcytosine-specific restriction enzyme B
MNLARVEHYFAEMLSAMETPDRRIPLYEGRFVTLPPNVFLNGSVNMDEATHPFSRKVIDRANTIEFTEVQIDRILGSAALPRIALPEIASPERQRIFLQSRRENVGEALERLRGIDRMFAETAVAILAELNAHLTPRGLHFGYRVRDEALRYCAAAFTAEGTGLLHADVRANLTTALDLQILQKVLPRLSGTTETLERPLASLETWARDNDFPRTAAKLARMRIRATEEGIVTFYEL